LRSKNYSEDEKAKNAFNKNSVSTISEGESYFKKDYKMRDLSTENSKVEDTLPNETKIQTTKLFKQVIK
jgi:hypothetical protein